MSKECQRCTGIDMAELKAKAWHYDSSIAYEKTLDASIRSGDFLIRVLKETHNQEVIKQAEAKLLKIINDL